MRALVSTLLLLSATSQDLADSVSRFYREWSDATMKKGPDGYASYFASDATLLPPDAPPVVGRDRIRAWMTSQSDLPYRAQPESVHQDEIRVLGDVAVVRTTLAGKRVPKAGGDPVPFETKYLDVLRRSGDGRWEFVSRMWNSNVDTARGKP